MAAMTISELARSGRVGVETVRFYQRRGLLALPEGGGTRRAGIRHYGESDTLRLRFIRTAQRAGFTLAEIADLLALDAGDDRVRVRAMARHRIAELDASIAELHGARMALARLAKECAASEAGPCPIIAAFEND